MLGDTAGDLAGELGMADAAKGVDIARVRRGGAFARHGDAILA